MLIFRSSNLPVANFRSDASCGAFVSDVADFAQATRGNVVWLAIAGHINNLPAVSLPDMIGAESTLVVGVPSLTSGEPSDAVEHAIWLLGEGSSPARGH